LRKDGYLEQRRTCSGRVPKTTVRATDHGLHRLTAYAEALQAIQNRAGTPGTQQQKIMSGEDS
jgi:hypothetical protein